MTEREWLTGVLPQSMLAHLQQIGAADRKVRLFICACWRVRAHLLYDPPAMLAEIAAVEANRHHDLPQNYFPTYRDVWQAANSTSEVHNRWAAANPPEVGVPAARQVAFLRDLFGDPFRLPNFDGGWRTDTAVLLAKQMYESREFGAMPILADALQDAGCDNDDVLNHCRDANAVHICGCWVVDLVLGTE